MKKNIALCLTGITLLVFSITIPTATPLSSMVTLCAVGLIVFSVKGKLKRLANKAFVVPFVD